MIVLGVNAGYHDGAAALVVDGQLRRVVETERVVRRKRAHGISPGAAIAACLAAEGITLASVDVIASGWSFPNFPEFPGEVYTQDEQDAFYEWMLDPEGTVEQVYGTRRRRRPVAPAPSERPPLVFIPHHDAHAYSALYVNGSTDDAVSVIVADGRGELDSTSIGVGRAGSLSWLKKWPIHQSLGELYGIASEWTGMSFWDAGKLMGLASYGRPDQQLPLSCGSEGYEIACGDVSDVGPNKQHRALRSYLETYFRDQNYPHRRGDGHEIMAYANFAATVQLSLEQSMEALFRMLERTGGSDRLLVSGGVGMNCSMIGRLTRTSGVSDVFVPAFPYDCGVSVGAALAVAHRAGEPMITERLRSAYLGLSFTEDQIASTLGATGLHFQMMPDSELVDATVALLAENRLIGWFQGNAEVGQRALGNRSILGNPCDRANLVKINELKGREIWRPLAPSVLEEYLNEVFDVGPCRSPYDFMLAASTVRPAFRRMIPATVHVDGTARPQAVSRSTNPRYWQLIDRFRQETGVPCVLNTSFNLAGSPIVNSPSDAIETFIKSDLDALAIGNYLVTKAA